MRILLIKWIIYLLEKSYSKVILGFLLVSSVAYLSIFILRIPLHREFFIISIITLAFLLKNDIYWILYRLGYNIELKFKNYLGSHFSIHKGNDGIKSISEAVFKLADNKIGALITFEKQSPLVDFTKGAVKINADISTELILSIFNPKSPIHDGGMIISGSKIKHVGCFYPISNKKMNNDFGSRHRAAFGLSEITDSLTILVSEEKGKVYIINDSNISNSISNEDELIKLLIKDLG